MGIKILKQSDDFSNHYLFSCIHLAKVTKSLYKYGRTITSTTKNRFVNKLPDLSQLLRIS